ncbi:hypothetical protein V8E36_008930 [Tilletia maclaganii]
MGKPPGSCSSTFASKRARLQRSLMDHFVAMVRAYDGPGTMREAGAQHGALFDTRAIACDDAIKPALPSFGSAPVFDASHVVPNLLLEASTGPLAHLSQAVSFTLYSSVWPMFKILTSELPMLTLKTVYGYVSYIYAVLSLATLPANSVPGGSAWLQESILLLLPSSGHRPAQRSPLTGHHQCILRARGMSARSGFLYSSPSHINGPSVQQSA